MSDDEFQFRARAVSLGEVQYGVRVLLCKKEQGQKHVHFHLIRKVGSFDITLGQLRELVLKLQAL